jgi:hypothetical protein
VQSEEEEVEEAGLSAAEKAASSEGMRTPPALLPSLPWENPGRELFPVGRDPILPEAGRAEQQEAEGDELARMAEELHAAARRAAESTEVRCHPLAV